MNELKANSCFSLLISPEKNYSFSLNLFIQNIIHKNLKTFMSKHSDTSLKLTIVLDVDEEVGIVTGQRECIRFQFDA